MEARSTNAMGRFVHFGGDLACGVEDGVGAIFRVASTGSPVVLEPLSDSDTAAMTIRAKGAAALTLGNTSNTINFVGNSTLTGGLSVSAASTIAGILTVNSLIISTGTLSSAAGTSGGGAAPPNNPATWLEIRVNGSSYVIPLYGKA